MQYYRGRSTCKYGGKVGHEEASYWEIVHYLPGWSMRGGCGRQVRGRGGQGSGCNNTCRGRGYSTDREATYAAQP